MDPVLGTSFCLSLGDVILVQLILDGAPLRLLWIASKVYYIRVTTLTFLLFPRSVVMSIQLLPKLFSSFQQFASSDQGPHWVTTWASKELNMMELFFNNIIQYEESVAKGDITNSSLYSSVEEVQARLQFLSSVFSCELSPQDFSKLETLFVYT